MNLNKFNKQQKEAFDELMAKYKLPNGDWNIIDGYIFLSKFIKEQNNLLLEEVVKVMDGMRVSKTDKSGLTEMAYVYNTALEDLKTNLKNN